METLLNLTIIEFVSIIVFFMLAVLVIGLLRAE